MSQEIRSQIWKLQDELSKVVSSQKRAELTAEIEHLRRELNPDARIEPASNAAPSATPPEAHQPIDRKACGDRLKQAMKSLGWRVCDLMPKIGVTATALYDACYGKNMPVMEKACEFLKINPKWLATGSGETYSEMPPEPPVKPKAANRRAARLPASSIKAGIEQDLKSPSRKMRCRIENGEIDLAKALRRAADAAEAFDRSRDALKAPMADIAKIGAAL